MLGSAMIRGMLRRGIAVRVWSRSAHKAEALEADGARAFDGSRRSGERRGARASLFERRRQRRRRDRCRAAGHRHGESDRRSHDGLAARRRRARAPPRAKRGYSFVHAPVFMGPPMALQRDRRHDGLGRCGARRTRARRARRRCAAICAISASGPSAAATYKLMGNAMILAVVGGINDVHAHRRGARALARAGLLALRLLRSLRANQGTRQTHGRRGLRSGVDARHGAQGRGADASRGPSRAPSRHRCGRSALLRNVSDRGLGGLDLAAVAQR